MEEFETKSEVQGTIPATEERAEETEQHSSSTAPQGEEEKKGEGDSENAVGGEGGEPEWTLPVVYNHENRSLTKDEATRYAQLGMKYSESGFDIDKIKPLYNKLDYLAALQDTTPDELIDKLTEAQDESYRAELSERFGEDEDSLIEDMMALRRSQQKDKYEKVVADRKAAEKNRADAQEASLNARLAEEFGKMRAEYPELTDFAALPKEVKKAAAEGMSLEHAYLKHRRSEEAKASAARESAERAKNASAGSMTGDPDEIGTAERQYLNALWGR